MIEHKLSFLIAALSTSVLVSNNEMYQLFAVCAIGGLISGFVGSTVFPVRGISFSRCWLVNMCLSILGAPLLTLWVADEFPQFPQPVVALAASGVMGTCGVLILRKKLNDNGIDTPERNSPRKPKNRHHGE